MQTTRYMLRDPNSASPFIRVEPVGSADLATRLPKDQPSCVNAME